MSAIAEHFWDLCLEVDEAFQRVDDVRPSLTRILQPVRSAPEERQEFVQCFSDLIQGRRHGPWEVVYFCMRHLWWPKVYEPVTNAPNENEDFRDKTVMAHIRGAYAECLDDDYLY